MDREYMHGKYKIINDPDYGFNRLDPIPSQEEVEKFYLEEFYTGEYKSFNDSSLEVQQEEKEFFDFRWELIANKIKSHLGNLNGKSIFDIGAGYCQALMYFQKAGMICSGIEPSKEGSEYGNQNGMKIFQTGIENFSVVGDERFDSVILVNVLEHLRKPAETLINIKNQLLKKNGILVIDVPNEFNDFQLIANEEYKLNNWWLCPPNHINYFSSSSLTSLLEKTGYEIIHSVSSFPLEMFMLFGDVYVGNGVVGKACHNKRVKFELLMKKYNRLEKLEKLYSAFAELDLGRQVVTFAVPKNK